MKSYFRNLCDRFHIIQEQKPRAISIQFLYLLIFSSDNPDGQSKITKTFCPLFPSQKRIENISVIPEFTEFQQ